MATICEIEFENNPSKVYYSGQVLKGSVVLHLPITRLAREIYIHIEGKAFCNWSVNRGNRVRNYTGNESYVNERKVFIDGTNGDVIVAAGIHLYTFEYRLPDNLPTSLEGTYGHIRYTATVNIVRTASKTLKFAETFSVIKAFNLNNDASLCEPVRIERNAKFLSCVIFCCGAPDPLTIIAKIPVSGYTPGQTINLHLQVANFTNQNVNHITVQFIKEITYHVNNSMEKTETAIIIEKKTEGFNANMNDSKNVHVNLLLPSIPPSDTILSSVCKVCYVLRITAAVSGMCNINPVIDIPITIGTHAITTDANVSSLGHESIIIHPSFALRQNHIISDDPVIIPTAPSPEKSLSDPPTYEEATQTNRDTHYTNTNVILKNPVY